MHPIGRPEQMMEWLKARPWKPNALLLVLYVLMAAAATQIEPDPCKCSFHPVTDFAVFQRNYGLLLVGLFAFHFTASAHVLKQSRQVFLVGMLTALGLICIPLALETASAPRKFESTNEVIVF